MDKRLETIKEYSSFEMLRSEFQDVSLNNKVYISE